MATHDAYVWLAGVKGIGNFIQDPFTQLLSLVYNLTGISLASIGFWSPVIFIPLLAVPVCLMARFLRLPEGGLVFGILATSGLGFLVRTRLGFCDTDVVNLLFPVATISTLALWLNGMGRENHSDGDEYSRKQIAWAFLVGVLGKMSVFVYPGSSSIILPAFGLSAVIGIARVNPKDRFLLFNGLLLIFSIIFADWKGGLLVGAWTALTHARTDLSAKVQIVVLGILFIAVVFVGNFWEIVQALIYRLYLYTKVGTPDMVSNATGLKLPDIAQSVREAQNLDWSLLGPRMGGTWVVFVLGLIGFCFAGWRKPALLVFLPFLALGLASVKLGNRFAMYGTVGIGVGLGLGMSVLMHMLKQSQGRRWIAQLSMACVALWPSAEFMQQVGPFPVLPQAYAQTFLDLRSRTEPDALLWQWWDYGYAGQYYAERATFGDGARHDGAILYPLAKVHATDSPLQARQIMEYFGQVLQEQGSKNTTDSRAALMIGDPLADLRKMDSREARKYVDNFASTKRGFPNTVPSYFVVSWENLRLAGWISYYGNWDIVTGTSSPGKLQQLQGDVRIDSKVGSLSINGKSTRIDSLDVVDPQGPRRFNWPNGSGSHVVVNQASKQVFLMDSKMYRSMMVQMLIAPPEEFAEDFTLVVDKYPWVRAYKVKG